MPKQFISGLIRGAKTASFFSVKYKEPVHPYGTPFKGYMFSAGLSDKTGEVPMNFFGGINEAAVKELFESFSVGDVIHVEGIISEFRGKLQVNADFIRKANPSEYRLGDFVAETNQNVDEMMKKIDSVRADMKNPHLKALLDNIFSDAAFVESFKLSPAAMFMHHNCVGGLLEHVWGVLQFCETAAIIHPSLDRDLLLSGAILHDIGKIVEFETTTHIKVSEEGMLRGHMSIGEEMLHKKMDEIEGFPKILKLKILHMIISHHGKKEYGCAKEPQFPEAYALYAADEFDSKITQYIRVKKDCNTEDFRVYTQRFGEMYVK